MRMAKTGEIKVDQKVIDTLLQRFKQAEAARKNKYQDNWDKARKYYDGEQWDEIEKLAWYQSEPTYNKVFEFVEVMRSYLADNKWGLDVFPYVMPKDVKAALHSDDPNDLTPTQEALGITPQQEIEFMSDKVNKLLDFLWVDQRMSNKLAQVLLFCFLYGTGFMKAYFDPSAVDESGIGQIVTKVLSPRYIFPDPDATDVHDASYIIEHHPVTFRWIIENYPDKAEEVKAKGLGSDTEHAEKKGTRVAGSVDSEEAQRVDVYECWYKDSTLAEEDDGTGKEVGTAAYPQGRLTFLTKSGVVLDDKPNPYTMFPYVRFIELPRPAEFFGDATVWRGFPIQDNINSLLRSIIDNGTWLSHGMWVVDNTSGVTPDMLAGFAPRDTVVKNVGSEVERKFGEPLPGTQFQTLDQQVEAFYRVVGLPSVLLGIVPSRQPVGTVEMQKEAGDVRTRERQRRVEESLSDLGQLWLDIVAEYWKDVRTFHAKKLTGGLEMFGMSTEDLKDWKWSIQVIPGSTAPYDGQGMLDKALALVERAGVQFPPEYLVELARLPGAISAINSQMAEMQGADNGGAPAEQEAPMEAPMQEGEMPPMGEMPAEPPMDPEAQAMLENPPPNPEDIAAQAMQMTGGA